MTKVVFKDVFLHNGVLLVDPLRDVPVLLVDFFNLAMPLLVHGQVIALTRKISFSRFILNDFVKQVLIIKLDFAIFL